MSRDAAVAVSAAPPASVGGLLILGYPLETWVLIGTAVYTVLATYVLVRDKLYLPWKERRERRT